MASKLKVKMIADAVVGNDAYASGREYLVDPYVFNSIRQSCELVDTIECDNAPESKPVRGIANALVVISHGIGNVINKTPMIKMLHEKTGAQIDLLVDQKCPGVLEHWNLIRKIYIYGRGVGPELCQNEYDIIINGIPSGFNLNVLGLNKDVITGETRWLNGMHEVEANVEILKGIKISGVIPDTYIPVQSVSFPAGRYIGISAGYLGENFKAKNWGYKKYAELIELLNKKYPEHKVIVFGTGKDRNIFRYLQNKGLAVDCVDKYTIQETAYIISKCDFMVCNDTGLGHVAGALGIKTYSIFGPSNITKNHPWTSSNVISLNLPCQPCQYTSNWTQCKNIACMDIPADIVMERIADNEVLATKRNLGIIMATYNRPEFLNMTLSSLKSCSNFDNIKICIINDGSSDEAVQSCINKFTNSLKNKIDVRVVKHGENYGKMKYSLTLKEGLEQLSDCQYVLFMPDDIIVNPGLFDVVRASYKYFSEKIRVINFMADSRALRGGKSLYASLDDYDNYFDYVGWTDGFLALFEYKTLYCIEFSNEATEEGSNTFPVINRQLLKSGYKQLRLRQSLCLHVGTVSSIMNPEERARKPIETINAVLFDVPKIIKQ